MVASVNQTVTSSVTQRSSISSAFQPPNSSSLGAALSQSTISTLAWLTVCAVECAVTCKRAWNIDLKTNKQTNKQRNKQRNKETKKQRNKETKKQRNKETKKERKKQTNKQKAEKQKTERPKNRTTKKQRSKQAERQRSRKPQKIRNQKKKNNGLSDPKKAENNRTDKSILLLFLTCFLLWLMRRVFGCDDGNPELKCASSFLIFLKFFLVFP